MPSQRGCCSSSQGIAAFAVFQGSVEIRVVKTSESFLATDIFCASSNVGQCDPCVLQESEVWAAGILEKVLAKVTRKDWFRSFTSLGPLMAFFRRHLMERKALVATATRKRLLPDARSGHSV